MIGALVARQSVVRKSSAMPWAIFGQHVGRGRRYQDRLDALRHGNVFDSALHIGLRLCFSEHLSDDLAPGKRREGEGRDKFAGMAGHHHLDFDTSVLKLANNLRRLIGCDSSGNPKHDAHEVFHFPANH
jgi:hypothetical protein